MKTSFAYHFHSFYVCHTGTTVNHLVKGRLYQWSATTALVRVWWERRPTWLLY